MTKSANEVNWLVTAFAMIPIPPFSRLSSKFIAPPQKKSTQLIFPAPWDFFGTFPKSNF